MLKNGKPRATILATLAVNMIIPAIMTVGHDEPVLAVTSAGALMWLLRHVTNVVHIVVMGTGVALGYRMVGVRPTGEGASTEQNVFALVCGFLFGIVVVAFEVWLRSRTAATVKNGKA